VNDAALWSRAPKLSPTLAINEAVKARIRGGDEIVHLGFGEAGVPVHPLLRQALAAASADGGYGEVAGSAALRESIAAYYTRRGLDTERSQIVVGPGSKALLYALMIALEGDLVLPQPAWVSYGAQAMLARKHVIPVPIPPETGGIPDPARLRAEVARARSAGRNPQLLLVTQPDNPTGTFPSRSRLEAVLSEAAACGLFVISDEIYGDLVHTGKGFTSAATISPTNCVLTSGLSKSMALGGWRVGVARVPDTTFGQALLDRVLAIASEIWSCIPGPVTAAAQLAYDEPPEIVAHVHASRRLHSQVSQTLYAAIQAVAGVTCRPPTAAFYLYPDLEGARGSLRASGVDGSSALAHALLEEHGIAVLPGDAFGDDPSALRVRVAASLLYGTTDDERWAALEAAAADRAHELASVMRAANRLHAALDALAAGRRAR
jgi:aspartate/methionine/tyrosine aminotransferase